MRLVRFVIFIALMALPVQGRAEEARAGGRSTITSSRSSWTPTWCALEG